MHGEGTVERIVAERCRLAPDAQDFDSEASYNDALDFHERSERLCKQVREVISALAPEVQVEDDNAGVTLQPSGIRLDTVDYGLPRLGGETIVPALALLYPVYWAGSYWEPPEWDYQPKGVYTNATSAVVAALLLIEEDRLWQKVEAWSYEQERQFLKGIEPELDEDTPRA